MTETQQQIAEFRGLLKTWLPKISVRQGRGTAAAWIDITGSQTFGHFTEEEIAGLKGLGFTYGANAAVISPEDRAFHLGHLRQLNYEMRQAEVTPAEYIEQLVEAREAGLRAEYSEET